MAFRGFNDDKIDLMKTREANAVRMAGINQSAKASKRSADENAANREEGARQADMQNDRAVAQMDQNKEIQAQEMGMKVKEMSIRERQFKINEGTFARLEEKHQQDLVAQEAWKSQDTAFGLAIMRKMATSNGPVPPSYFNAINAFRGKAVGDEGYITGAFPIIDPKTKANYGWGTTQYGKEGKEIQSVLDPHEFLETLRKSMPPKGYAELLNTIDKNNQFSGVDKVRATTATQRQKLMAEEEKNKLDAAKLRVSAAKAAGDIVGDPSDIAVLEKRAQGYTQKRWIGPNTEVEGSPEAKEELARVMKLDKERKAALSDAMNYGVNADGEAGGGTVAAVRVMGTDGNLYEQNSDGEFYKVEEDPALPSPPAAAQDETAAAQAVTNAPPAVETPAAAVTDAKGKTTTGTGIPKNAVAPNVVRVPEASASEPAHKGIMKANVYKFSPEEIAENKAAYEATLPKQSATAETADVEPIAKKNGWKFPTKHPMVKNEDGSKSNVILRATTMTEDDGDWTYVYPTMVDGKQLTDKEAMKVADSHNWKGYPRFKTVKEANAYAEANHGNIAADGTIMAKASASKSASKKEPEGKKKRERQMVEDKKKYPELGRFEVERGDDGQWYIVTGD
jgi:hypothetical protein